MAKKSARRKPMPEEVQELPHFEEKIKALQQALGLTKNQKAFATSLGVSQQTASAWLRGDKSRPPSSAAFFRMANLATNEDLVVDFLGLAGLSIDAILRASSWLTKNMSEVLTGGSIQDFVVNGNEFGGMFSDREVITVDISLKASPSLQPFWDSVLLIEFTPSIEDRMEPGRQWRRWPQAKKYWVGRLALQCVGNSPDVQLAILECDLSQRAGRGLARTWEVGDKVICIGSWSLGLRSTPRLNDLSFSEFRNWQEIARKEMKVFEGCQIIGKVVRWLACSTQNTEKGK